MGLVECLLEAPRSTTLVAAAALTAAALTAATALAATAALAAATSVTPAADSDRDGLGRPGHRDLGYRSGR
jgi:uncharacterized membrane protein